MLLFEDAAHVAGLTGATGTVSDAAAYSFFTNKNMTTAEGGMVVVTDEARRQRVRLLRAHGMTASTLDRDRGRAVGYDVVECGYNFRMDELRGALGLVQIERLPDWNRTRVELTARYRTRLAEEVPGGRCAVRRGPSDLGSHHARGAARGLRPHGGDGLDAGRRRADEHPLPGHPPSSPTTARGSASVTLPHTEHFSRRELTLPLHPALSSADVDRVVAALREALESCAEPA